MGCCLSTIVPFTNVTTTTIGYSAPFAAKYGSTPRATVYYWDESTKNFYTNNDIPASLVNFDGAEIFIDHGGPASGYVKIS